MFKNQFVACLKVQGQILRENGETVRLPFGSEYSLLLKNLSGRRAVVKVEIDGQDVLDGRRLVVNVNSNLELERFIKNGDLAKGNRFKFIHKDEKIQAHRGDRADDGIVRVSWQYERPAPTITYRYVAPVQVPQIPGTPWVKPYWHDHYTNCTTGSLNCDATTNVRGMATSGIVKRSVVAQIGERGAEAVLPLKNAAPQSDEGITVAGSESRQSFTTACTGILEPEVNVITLKLLGESPVTGETVTKPVTVKEPLKCPTCGTDNRSKHTFCHHCGTCLGD